MKNEKQILEEVEKTLNVLDDLPKLEANPYLYTRIKTRLSEDKSSIKNTFYEKIKLKYVALAVVVLLNIVTLISYFENGNKDNQRDQLIYSLKRDYNITQNDF